MADNRKKRRADFTRRHGPPGGAASSHDLLCYDSTVDLEKAKKLGLGAAKYLGTTVGGIVIAALIKGESLAGLANVKPLLHFLTTGVPLSLFLALLITCVWMIPSVIKEKRPRRPKLHVSWERITCLWALGKFGETPMMQIQGEAVICSSGTDEKIIIREAFVKGTKPLMNLVDAIPVAPGDAHACRIITMVAPVIRKPTEALEAELILRDHKGREYKADKMIFKSANPSGSPALG